MSSPQSPPLATLTQSLNRRHIGRQRVIHGLLAAVLAGQHAYLVGPPGTDKTSLLRDLAGCITGASFVQVDLHGQSSIDRFFGPIDIPRWERGDRAWARASEGFLPEAHLALLDEVNAAPSTITDMLLRLLAERTWLNGHATQASPLITAVGAGNDIPVSPQLWDRFLVRQRVDYLSDPGDVAALVALASGRGGASARAPSKGVGNASAKLILASLHRHQKAAAALPLPAPVASAMAGLRMRLHSVGIPISDRRLVESVGLVRAAALLRGADTVGAADLRILADAWWLEVDQIPTVAGLVGDAVRGCDPDVGGGDQVDDDHVEVGGMVDQPAEALARITARLYAVQSKVEKATRWGAAGRDLIDAAVDDDLDGVEVDLDALAGVGVDVGEARFHLEGLRELVAIPGAVAV